MIRDRGGRWHYRFKLQGKEYAETTGLEATERNRRAAEKIEEAERVNAKVALQTGKTEAARMPFLDGAAEFLNWCENVEYRGKESTWLRIRGSFASLVEFFGEKAIADLTPGDMERFKMLRLQKHGVKDVTLRHDLHNFSLFVAYARKQKWLTGDPMEDVTIPSDAEAQRDNILTPEMEGKYFAHAFDVMDRKGRRNLYDVGRLMILQGPRPEELMVLKQEHVDLARGEMRIVAGKSKAAKRTLSLCQESIEILTARLDGQSIWVFPSDRKKDRHIAKLQTPQDKVCRESEISCVIYDLRHTFATRMIEATGDPMTLAKILGHANLRSIQRYVHITDEHAKATMQKFEAAEMRRKLRIVGR